MNLYESMVKRGFLGSCYAGGCDLRPWNAGTGPFLEGIIEKDIALSLQGWRNNWFLDASTIFRRFFCLSLHALLFYLKKCVALGHILQLKSISNRAPQTALN
jgi:hypothetical protein